MFKNIENNPRSVKWPWFGERAVPTQKFDLQWVIRYILVNHKYLFLTKNYEKSMFVYITPDYYNFMSSTRPSMFLLMPNLKFLFIYTGKAVAEYGLWDNSQVMLAEMEVAGSTQ